MALKEERIVFAIDVDISRAKKELEDFRKNAHSDINDIKDTIQGLTNALAEITLSEGIKEFNDFTSSAGESLSYIKENIVSLQKEIDKINVKKGIDEFKKFSTEIKKFSKNISDSTGQNIKKFEEFANYSLKYFGIISQSIKNMQSGLDIINTNKAVSEMKRLERYIDANLSKAQRLQEVFLRYNWKTGEGSPSSTTIGEIPPEEQNFPFGFDLPMYLPYGGIPPWYGKVKHRKTRKRKRKGAAKTETQTRPTPEEEPLLLPGIGLPPGREKPSKPLLPPGMSPEEKVAKKWFSIKEVEEYLGLSGRTLRDWAKKGHIDAQQLKGKWYIHPSSVADIIDYQMTKLARQDKKYADILHRTKEGKFKPKFPDKEKITKKKVQEFKTLLEERIRQKLSKPDYSLKKEEEKFRKEKSFFTRAKKVIFGPEVDKLTLPSYVQYPGERLSGAQIDIGGTKLSPETYIKYKPSGMSDAEWLKQASAGIYHLSGKYADALLPPGMKGISGATFRSSGNIIVAHREFAKQYPQSPYHPKKVVRHETIHRGIQGLQHISRSKFGRAMQPFLGSVKEDFARITQLEALRTGQKDFLKAGTMEAKSIEEGFLKSGVQNVPLAMVEELLPRIASAYGINSPQFKKYSDALAKAYGFSPQQMMSYFKAQSSPKFWEQRESFLATRRLKGRKIQMPTGKKKTLSARQLSKFRPSQMSEKEWFSKAKKGIFYLSDDMYQRLITGYKGHFGAYKSDTGEIFLKGIRARGLPHELTHRGMGLLRAAGEVVPPSYTSLITKMQTDATRRWLTSTRGGKSLAAGLTPIDEALIDYTKGGVRTLVKELGKETSKHYMKKYAKRFAKIEGIRALSEGLDISDKSLRSIIVQNAVERAKVQTTEEVIARRVAAGGFNDPEVQKFLQSYVKSLKTFHKQQGTPVPRNLSVENIASFFRSMGNVDISGRPFNAAGIQSIMGSRLPGFFPANLLAAPTYTNLPNKKGRSSVEGWFGRIQREGVGAYFKDDWSRTKSRFGSRWRNLLGYGAGMLQSMTPFLAMMGIHELHKAITNLIDTFDNTNKLLVSKSRLWGIEYAKRYTYGVSTLEKTSMIIRGIVGDYINRPEIFQLTKMAHLRKVAPAELGMATQYSKLIAETMPGKFSDNLVKIFDRVLTDIEKRSKDIFSKWGFPISIEEGEGFKRQFREGIDLIMNPPTGGVVYPEKPRKKLEQAIRASAAWDEIINFLKTSIITVVEPSLTAFRNLISGGTPQGSMGRADMFYKHIVDFFPPTREKNIKDIEAQKIQTPNMEINYANIKKVLGVPYQGRNENNKIINAEEGRFKRIDFGKLNPPPTLDEAIQNVKGDINILQEHFRKIFKDKKMISHGSSGESYKPGTTVEADVGRFKILHFDTLNPPATVDDMLKDLNSAVDNVTENFIKNDKNIKKDVRVGDIPWNDFLEQVKPFVFKSIEGSFKSYEMKVYKSRINELKELYQSATTPPERMEINIQIREVEGAALRAKQKMMIKWEKLIKEAKNIDMLPDPTDLKGKKKLLKVKKAFLESIPLMPDKDVIEEIERLKKELSGEIRADLTRGRGAEKRGRLRELMTFEMERRRLQEQQLIELDRIEREEFFAKPEMKKYGYMEREYKFKKYLEKKRLERQKKLERENKKRVEEEERRRRREERTRRRIARETARSEDYLAKLVKQRRTEEIKSQFLARQKDILLRLTPLQEERQRLIEEYRQRQTKQARIAREISYSNTLRNLERQEGNLVDTEIGKDFRYFYGLSDISRTASEMNLQIASSRRHLTSRQLARKKFDIMMQQFNASTSIEYRTSRDRMNKMWDMYVQASDREQKLSSEEKLLNRKLGITLDSEFYYQKYLAEKRKLQGGNFLVNPSVARGLFQASLEAYQTTGSIYYKRQAQEAIQDYIRAQEQKVLEQKQREEERIQMERDQIQIQRERLRQEYERTKQNDALRDAIENLTKEEEELRKKDIELRKQQQDLINSINGLKGTYDLMSTQTITVQVGGETVTAVVGPAANTASPY